VAEVVSWPQRRRGHGTPSSSRPQKGVPGSCSQVGAMRSLLVASNYILRADHTVGCCPCFASELDMKRQVGGEKSALYSEQSSSGKAFNSLSYNVDQLTKLHPQNHLNVGYKGASRGLDKTRLQVQSANQIAYPREPESLESDGGAAW
jgi:hypothetical protein